MRPCGWIVCRALSRFRRWLRIHRSRYVYPGPFDPQIQVRVSMALYTCSLPARAHASTHSHTHTNTYMCSFHCIYITYACVHGSVQYMRSLNRVRITYIRHGTLYTSHIHVFMPPCICSLPYTLTSAELHITHTSTHATVHVTYVFTDHSLYRS